MRGATDVEKGANPSRLASKELRAMKTNRWRIEGGLI